MPTSSAVHFVYAAGSSSSGKPRWDLPTAMDYLNFDGGENSSGTGQFAVAERESPSLSLHFVHTTGEAVAIALVLSAITLVCVVGNLLIMIAVCLVRKLRTPSNYLIANLAVADLLVGLLVMPWAIVYDVLGRWPFGSNLCFTWITCDVLLSTASILNLMMISVDRYLIITRPLHYAPRRKGKLMLMYTAAAWFISLAIGLTPLIVGWTPETSDGICLVNQDLGYQIYATIGAFYLPLSVMVALYGKVLYVSMKIAKKDSRRHCLRRAGDVAKRRSQQPTEESEATLPRPTQEDREPRSSVSLGGGENNNYVKHEEDSGGTVDSSNLPLTQASRLKIGRSWRCKSLRGRSGSAPNKAVTTLGVIMGGFIVFWLPFFIVALIRPFCKGACAIPTRVQSLLTWLGYLNSCMNPIVYIRFNREYRTPFKEILLLRCGTLEAAVRREEYRHQYGTIKRSKPGSWV